MRVDPPRVDDRAVLDDEHRVEQVDDRADVVRDDEDDATHLRDRGTVRDLDDAVVIGHARDDRPVAVIAEACGFYEPSTFSRTFRRAYGVSPSDARAAARAGSALGPRLSPAMAAETRSLQACLQGL